MLKWEVGYWKSLFQRAKEREEVLKKQLQEKEGKIRDLTKRLFGKSNEKSGSGKNKGNLKPTQGPRPRGQQKGSKSLCRYLNRFTCDLQVMMPFIIIR